MQPLRPCRATLERKTTQGPAIAAADCDTDDTGTQDVQLLPHCQDKPHHYATDHRHQYSNSIGALSLSSIFQCVAQEMIRHTLRRHLFVTGKC